MAGDLTHAAAAQTDTTGPLDRVGDLDLAISELSRREEQLRAEYERNERLLGTARDAIEMTVGTGEAEHGRVRVRADATGHVTEVHLEPDALRMGSIGRLEAAVVEACNAAVDAAARRLGAAAADPMTDFFDSMPEVTRLLDADSYRAYVEPLLPASTADGSAPATTSPYE